MIKKKICMVGAFAVGKTSLVQRFVHSIFSDKYLTTVGVKIDKKVVEIDGESLQILLWDIQGEDEYTRLQLNYLKGAAAIMLVVDGTRGSTLTTALSIKESAENATTTPLACVMLINKSDLESSWEVTGQDIARLEDDGLRVFRTSAKQGSGVEEAFTALARTLLET